MLASMVVAAIAATLPDGPKRYEFVDPDSGYSVMTQLRMFQKMHRAVTARPVKNEQPRY
jgi:hypothetical protein